MKVLRRSRRAPEPGSLGSKSGGYGNGARAAATDAPLAQANGGQGAANGNGSSQDNGQNRVQDNEPGGGQGNGQGSQGNGQGAGNGAGGPGTGLGLNAPELKNHDWLTVQGTVLVADNELTLQTAEGEVIVGMGQTGYREQSGFAATVGDEVVVYGFYEDGEFKAGTVDNLTTGATLTLRDTTGRPMWAGNGNRRNQP